MTPDQIYDRMVEAGILEPAVIMLGRNEDRRCFAGRWVRTNELGTRDQILPGKAKALEVLAEAPSWEALDVLLTEAIAALQPGVDTSPSLASVRSVPEASGEVAVHQLPPAEPSTAQIQAIEEGIVEAAGELPVA